jgi:hypothetical protein
MVGERLMSISDECFRNLCLSEHITRRWSECEFQEEIMIKWAKTPERRTR